MGIFLHTNIPPTL